MLVARFLCRQEVSAAAIGAEASMAFCAPALSSSLVGFCDGRVRRVRCIVKSRVDLVGFRAELSVKSGALTLP